MDVQAVASVTRNPAVPRLMGKAFHVVSPDLSAADPLHHYKESALVRHISEVYAKYVGGDPEVAPFVYDRYGNGLYGHEDPGRLMALPEIANHPGNGIIMVATAKRSYL